MTPLRAPFGTSVIVATAVALSGCAAPPGDPNHDASNPVATLHTSMGEIAIELYRAKVPETVDNFLSYARARFYEGTIFHRVIDDFVVQGGGVLQNGTEKPTQEPIPFEIDNDLTHVDGAVGMARTEDPDSATSQFYIADGKQHRLDDSNRLSTRKEHGYAVFARVVAGMDVVRAIAKVPTDSNDQPLRDVVLERVTVAGS